MSKSPSITDDPALETKLQPEGHEVRSVSKKIQKHLKNIPTLSGESSGSNKSLQESIDKQEENPAFIQPDPSKITDTTSESKTPIEETTITESGEAKAGTISKEKKVASSHSFKIKDTEGHESGQVQTPSDYIKYFVSLIEESDDKTSSSLMSSRHGEADTRTANESPLSMKPSKSISNQSQGSSSTQEDSLKTTATESHGAAAETGHTISKEENILPSHSLEITDIGGHGTDQVQTPSDYYIKSPLSRKPSKSISYQSRASSSTQENFSKTTTTESDEAKANQPISKKGKSVSSYSSKITDTEGQETDQAQTPSDYNIKSSVSLTERSDRSSGFLTPSGYREESTRTIRDSTPVDPNESSSFVEGSPSLHFENEIWESTDPAQNLLLPTGSRPVRRQTSSHRQLYQIMEIEERHVDPNCQTCGRWALLMLLICLIVIIVAGAAKLKSGI